MKPGYSGNGRQTILQLNQAHLNPHNDLRHTYTRLTRGYIFATADCHYHPGQHTTEKKQKRKTSRRYPRKNNADTNFHVVIYIQIIYTG